MNYKIRVANEAESKEAQELLFELGYGWRGVNPRNSIFIPKKLKEYFIINYEKTKDMQLSGVFDNSETLKTHKEITISELRDLVVLKRNDPKDENVYQDGDAPCLYNLYLTSDKNLYFFSYGKGWKLSAINDDDEYRKLLKPIIKEPVMKEFLNPDQGYKLVCCAIGETSIPENWIEVPKGSEKLTAYRLELVFWTVRGGYSWHTKNSTEWDDNKSFGLTNFDQYFDDETVILWQRETLNDKVASAEVARQEFIGAPFDDSPEFNFEAVDDVDAEFFPDEKHAHYKKDISHLDTLDIYRVTELFNPHACVAHIAKKALCSGQRGHKDLLTDIQDIIDTAERWKEMLIEDEKAK